jgi:hypothetical protein
MKLFAIATGHASGEDIERATVGHRKRRTGHDRAFNEDVDDCLNVKRTRGRRQQADASATTVSRTGGRPPTEETPHHFEKLLEAPCLNHPHSVQHAYKDCKLLREFLRKTMPFGRGLEPLEDERPQGAGPFPLPRPASRRPSGSSASPRLLSALSAIQYN